MSKSVVTAASAGRAKTLSRAKVLRGKENNHKPAAEEAAAVAQHEAKATELVPTHSADAQMSDVSMSDTISLAGDFSFTGVMADAAASADLMAGSAGFAGMAGFAQDSTSDNGSGGFLGGGSAPLIIGGLVAAGAVVAVVASGGDDDDDNTAPTVAAQTGAGNEDTSITGKLTATDADNNTLTYALKTGTTAPAGFTLGADGTYTLDAKNAAYQSLAAGKTQDVAVNFTVSDGKGGSADSTLTIKVTGVNDAPTVAATQAITTDENVAKSFTVAGTDVDTSDTLTYSLGTTAAKSGTVTVGAGGQLTYTPNANFDGTDSFTVNVKDAAGLTATQTVNVTVNNVGPTTATIALSGAGANTDADNVNTTYNVGLGSSYNYTITGLDAGGDKIVGPAGVTPTVINSNFTDGSVIVQYAANGNVVQITLAGLTTAQDGQILGLNSLNTVFGAGTVA